MPNTPSLPLLTALFLAATPALAQDAAAPEAEAQPETPPAAGVPAAPADGGETATPDAEPSAEVPGAPASLIAQLAGADGTAMGTVTAAPTASGVMLLTLSLTGVPAGIHGVHVHETGECAGDGFDAAGGHVAGEHEHGVMAEGGTHPGDLPNIHVPESGVLEVEFFAPDLTPELLTDADGAAFVVHADPDDYSGQPSGNSGDRIACGVLSPAG